MSSADGFTVRTRNDLDGGVAVTVQLGPGTPAGTIVWDAEQLLGSGEIEVGDFTSDDVETIVLGSPGKYRVQVGVSPADHPSTVIVAYSLLRELPASQRASRTGRSAPRVPGQPNPVWRGNSLPQIVWSAVSAVVLLALGIYVLAASGGWIGGVLILFAIAGFTGATVGFVRYRQLRK